MRRVLYLSLAAAAVAALTIGSLAVAGGGKKNVKAEPLSGYLEAPPISSAASGTFEATIDDQAQEIHYTVTYTGLEGDVLQSHIHFGQRSVSAGIAAFLCSNLGNGPAGTPACPPSPGSVTGTIHPTDVIGPAAQGIAAGEFQELVDAIRAGRAYANVHSTKFTSGEIRGQINDKNQKDD